MTIPFDNSYARLPDRFYVAQPPVPVASPEIIAVNTRLARELEIDPSDLKVEVLSGNRVPDGASPLAAAYAGHQFGGFVPQLGDGRAVLLGEVDTQNGRFDIQLKGAGRTPFSRGGDGRAAVGPVIREYILSEAMYALGIPTTRSLAAVTTGEAVYRETDLPGAVLTRVASSHIRVGTFQYFYARQDQEGLQALTDHVIARHYPDADGPVALLFAVMDRQAKLIAQWMAVGFIHGVMNTDNMAISGETIDYGPCAFMEGYHPDTVFSSIDRKGRYSWINQPKIAHWNLSQLATCLVPLADGEVEELQSVLNRFPDLFDAAFVAAFSRKLGLAETQESDPEMIGALLNILAESRVDFTLFFRHLTAFLSGSDHVQTLVDTPAFTDWMDRWVERTNGDTDARLAMMRAANPIFIPRNHRVEEAIVAANSGDYAPFKKLNTVLARPFDEQPENAAYEAPATKDEEVHVTFCGT